MKKILLLFAILSVSVVTTACINNFAIQELNNKAETYMDKGDAQTAICRLKSSLDLDDSFYETHYNLAVAYNSTNNYDAAIAELNKVLELKPDFYDAYYTLGIVKEAIAYNIIEKTPDENGNLPELTLDEIADFNNKANDAIETYNEYLVKKPNASESQLVNDRIADLNKKIKEYTVIYDKKNSENENKIQEEMTSEASSEPKKEEETVSNEVNTETTEVTKTETKSEKTSEAEQ